MDINKNYKFIIIDEDLIYFFKDLKEIPELFNTTIYNTLARTRDSDLCTMYSIENKKEIDKNIKYLVTTNDKSYFKISNSIRKAAKDINIDHSSLAKQLKNEKYKSVGGGNPGRKKKNTTSLTKGYSIFKIKDFDFGKYYQKLNYDEILITTI